MIQVLEQSVIDKIAAGEVAEKPASVVKELVENALDAGANAISVEIRDGGIRLIRVTDNGSGIPRDEVRSAFYRHATSKISGIEDLDKIMTLGFRGEALSSISAVSRLQMITKQKDETVGTEYEISGGEEGKISDIGAPNGTTVIVRDLFYNTPARLNFLKSPATEASAIADLMERFSFSHPDVSFRLIVNGNPRFSSSGNGRLKDLVYALYGKEAAAAILPVDYKNDRIQVGGCIGKPVISRGNRGYESFFVNGRYVKSALLTRALEEAVAPFMMQHRYPMAVLFLTLPPEDCDVNVHPAKTEIRFRQEGFVYDTVFQAVKEALSEKEFIEETPLVKEAEKKEEIYRAPEPFEVNRIREEEKKQQSTRVAESKAADDYMKAAEEPFLKTAAEKETQKLPESSALEQETAAQKPAAPAQKPETPPEKTETNFTQESLFEPEFLTAEARKKHRLIGQVFDTYWLIQMEDELFILDQHAAHEKVLYERRMKDLQNHMGFSQILNPPITVTLSPTEELTLNRCMDAFASYGYEISYFGGKEYLIQAVPADLYGLNVKELFLEILSDMEEEYKKQPPEMILSKLASMSCKAAVKGNDPLSFEEADRLISELLTLENPYACPHGRPTLIKISKRELEKRFKRIV